MKDLPEPVFYGPKKADVTLVTWGSQKLPCLDAIKKLNGVNILHFTCIFPIDEGKVLSKLKKCKKTILVENNSTAQFGGVLRQYLSWQPDFYLLRFDGRPHFAEDIIETVEKLRKDNFKGEKKIVVTEEEYEYFNPERYPA